VAWAETHASQSRFKRQREFSCFDWYFLDVFVLFIFHVCPKRNFPDFVGTCYSSGFKWKEVILCDIFGLIWTTYKVITVLTRWVNILQADAFSTATQHVVNSRCKTNLIFNLFRINLWQQSISRNAIALIITITKYIVFVM